MDRRLGGVAAIVIVIIVVTMAFTGCMGSNNTSSAVTVSEVKLVIDYNGSWAGTVQTVSSSKNINGTGHQEFTITRGNDSALVVYALAQKADASDGLLTISVEDSNGTTLRTASTSTPYGVASLWSIVAYSTPQSGMGMP